MEAIHDYGFWAATVATGVVGLAGVGTAIRRRTPTRWFFVARSVAIGLMLAQVVVGTVLYVQGERPGNELHVFYGLLVAITLAFAYIYRSALARRPALLYGLVLLFTMGLGLRAWSLAG
jgi:hypothetical protein